MNTSSEPAHDRLTAGAPNVGLAGTPLDSQEPPFTGPPQIKVGKRTALVSGKEAEIFTMTLGVETIELLPLRNWGQLDIYKWRVRGKLPGTPAGLEITFDHIKLLGETVSVKDAEGCAKLEKLFSEWLAVERENLELAKKKAQSKATAALPVAAAAPAQQPLHFHVEVDNKGMVHVHSVQGKETLASIGLNTAGFQSLISQGFMRKPHAMKTGALHDWVELDGVLFSFEKGNNDAAKLEEALNRSYLPASGRGQGKEVVVFTNAASSTGFDIQFPAKTGGLSENRRRPLTEEALELLQDAEHCGLVQLGIVIKLTRPTLIFKKKTPDGGERNLDRSPANTVRVADEDGDEKIIDLSQPVNYLHLSAVELTAVFNHPSINRHTQVDAASALNSNLSLPVPKNEQPSPSIQETSTSRLVPNQALSRGEAPIASTAARATISGTGEPTNGVPRILNTEVQKTAPTPEKGPVKTSIGPDISAALKAAEPVHQPPKPPLPQSEPHPNLWLKPILERQPIRYDWLTCLVYGRIAAWLHNSREGELFGRKCWFVEVNESEPEEQSMSDRNLKAIFLEADGGFGFVNGDWFCLFEKERATVGSNESSLKAEPVRLMGAGLDACDRFVFIVSDGHRSRWGVPEDGLTSVLARLKESGAVVLSLSEALESSEPLQVVWTVPVEQANPADPQALETRRAQP